MSETILLFRDNPYMSECISKVTATDPEQKGIILDQTIFYPQGGGQLGDTGELHTQSGNILKITNTIYSSDRKEILHILDEGMVEPGEQIHIHLDWTKRFSRMRVHTALHLLSVALPFPVTGGSIGEGIGRLDFDIAEAGLDKEEISAKINALIAKNATVHERWITDEELDANPNLVKTLSVKPPRGTGRIRLIEIEGIDLQPCGGTHVRNISEIGTVTVTGIEKKGKMNRRVKIAVS